MICEACAAAGDLTADPGPYPEAARTLATDMHGGCPGGTHCACRHRIPPVDELARRHATRRPPPARPA